MRPAAIVADEMFPEGACSYMDMEEVTIKIFCCIRCLATGHLAPLTDGCLQSNINILDTFASDKNCRKAKLMP